MKPNFPPVPPVQPVSAPTNRPSIPNLPAANDIANLYSAPVKAGAVGATGTPPMASGNVNELQPELEDSPGKSISEHECKLLSQRIELPMTGIAR